MTERRLRLAERSLVQFFRDNPYEELTADDAAIKFDIPRSSAVKYLSALSGDGIVERVSVYRMAVKLESVERVAEPDHGVMVVRIA